MIDTLAAGFITALAIGLFAGVAAAVTIPLGLGIMRVVVTAFQVRGCRRAYVRRITLTTSIVAAILIGIASWVVLVGATA